jgi:hypothetical protein
MEKEENTASTRVATASSLRAELPSTNLYTSEELLKARQPVISPVLSVRVLQVLVD